jgi:DnaJ family protein C protein 13
MEVTNRWPWSDVITLNPVIPKVQHNDATLTSGANELFTFTFMTRKRKSDTFKFSSEYRTEILCNALAFRSQFFDIGNRVKAPQFSCTKHHWSERKLAVTLEIDTHAVNQISSQTRKVVASYAYKDIDYLATVSDYPGAFVIATGGFNRLHLFASVDATRDDLLRKICDHAWTHVGCLIRIRKDSITFDHFQSNRFGRYSNDESITSLYEFSVHKVTCRDLLEPSKRTLALTENCLLERDPNSYSIITLKPLNEIFALVRSQTNAQQFSIEYIKGQVSIYTSTDRDALLASLLDGVRASGNVDVHVKMVATVRGHRIGPYSMPVDEEVESWHLKFLQTPPNGWMFNDAVLRFNANCAYSGLLHSVTQERLFAENKEKLIQIALGAFVEKEGDQDAISNQHLEEQFQCLRRLVASKAGFTAFTVCSRFRDCLGKKVVKALKRNNDAVIHSAIDMLCALMQVKRFKLLFAFVNSRKKRIY